MLLVLHESLILILLVKILYCCLLFAFFTVNMVLKIKMIECNIVVLLSKFYPCSTEELLQNCY